MSNLGNNIHPRSSKGSIAFSIVNLSNGNKLSMEQLEAENHRLQIENQKLHTVIASYEKATKAASELCHKQNEHIDDLESMIRSLEARCEVQGNPCDNGVDEDAVLGV